MPKKKRTIGSCTICTNRRARYDYELIDELEGGLVLQGSEVKSIRAGNVHINEAYAMVKNGECWLINAHIAPYENAGYATHDPRQDRKILLHAREIEKLQHEKEAKGLTLIPRNLHWGRGKVKMSLFTARGKKSIDKRQSIKEKDMKRQAARSTLDY